MEDTTTIREEKLYGTLVLLRPDGSQRSKFPLIKQKITFGRGVRFAERFGIVYLLKC